MTRAGREFAISLPVFVLTLPLPVLLIDWAASRALSLTYFGILAAIGLTVAVVSLCAAVYGLGMFVRDALLEMVGQWESDAEGVPRDE